MPSGKRRFWGEMDGCNKSTSTGGGTASTGLSAHVRGWDIGVRVAMWADGDEDVATVVVTGGSNNSSTLKYLGRFKRGKRGGVKKL